MGLKLTVDTGLEGLGYAFWDRLEKDQDSKPWLPVLSGVLRTRRRDGDRVRPWEERAANLVFNLYQVAISLEEPVTRAWVEYPELWSKSAKSQASASRGELFKLAFQAGAIYQSLSWEWETRVTLVSPVAWKGQLGKKALAARLLKRTGNKYRDHEADAIGIGLWLQDKL